MARRYSTPDSGFTLLELCIAVVIILMIISVAVPSFSGIFAKNHDEERFQAFDELVKEAHQRSLTERRPYVLVWKKMIGSKMSVLLRPDVPVEPNQKPSDVVRQWDIEKGDDLKLTCPAALMKGYEAVWTFWPGGACEPVTVTFKPKEGTGWVANYNPFTAEAVVRYE